MTAWGVLIGQSIQLNSSIKCITLTRTQRRSIYLILVINHCVTLWNLRCTLDRQLSSAWINDPNLSVPTECVYTNDTTTNSSTSYSTTWPIWSRINWLLKNRTHPATSNCKCHGWVSCGTNLSWAPTKTCSWPLSALDQHLITSATSLPQVLHTNIKSCTLDSLYSRCRLL